ncbi:MAG: DUF58 domain-containing protein [Vicingaceae bacterium]
MNTQELLKKVRKIEIKTKGLTNQIFSGEYHSAFKGRGMAFSEVREYQVGDEIRTIDWNVTARFNNPYVKIFEEERELTVMLLVDVSGSSKLGTHQATKRELAAEIAAVLSFSAIQNNDKVGVIFFSDKIEKFIPPKKGKSHILQIIRDLINIEPESNKTDIKQALEFFSRVIKKKSTAFIISDFIAPITYADVLKISNKRHDVVALEINDHLEYEFPNVGLLPVKDLETNQIKWVDTSNKKIRTAFKAQALKRKHELKELFRKSGVDHAEIDTEKGYVKPLMNLFKRR